MTDEKRADLKWAVSVVFCDDPCVVSRTSLQVHHKNRWPFVYRKVKTTLKPNCMKQLHYF